MPARMTVLGSINMDLVVYTQRLPASGETLLASSFQTFPGGKGANQAVAAARMGAQVQMLGKVGADAFGEQLVSNLRANHVSTMHVEQSRAPSGTALITVDAQGHNTILVVSGANSEVLPQDLENWRNALVNAEILLMQLEIPLETVVAAARLARANGVLVMLNPSPAQALPPELPGLIDVMVMNESETALISGEDVASPAELERAGRKLLDQGVGWVVITLGGQGAMGVGHEGVIHAPGFEVEVVDTVAAGDAFTGALAVTLAESKGFHTEPGEALARSARPMAFSMSSGTRSGLDILRIANAAGALAVTVRGAQPSLPTRRQVVDFLRSR